MKIINSTQNKNLKQLCKLHTKKERDHTGLFLVEGAHMIEEAERAQCLMEVHKGESQAMFDKWMEKCKILVGKSTYRQFKQSIYDIVSDFEKIELDTSVEICVKIAAGSSCCSYMRV